MKIALVDNMNNNYFAFARYLKDLNIDVHLYTIPNHHMKHFYKSYLYKLLIFHWDNVAKVVL
jgi:hypothetical protein